MTITTTITGHGTSTKELYFTYDGSSPMTVTYGDDIFYYVTNLQGDVVAIIDTNGVAVVTYTYDAWGNILDIDGSMKGDLGVANPFTYRGYVYDAESGLYYLQSRYYDPEVGRFINADALVATGQGLLGNNMFAYCNNNPVLFTDYDGYLPRSTKPKHPANCGCHDCRTEKSLLEQLLMALAQTDSEGCTFSAGITGGYTFGGMTKSISGCLSADSSNNYALQGTTSYGSSSGGGASLGLVMTYTNANNVQDLAGTSESTGVTLCSVAGISIDYISFVPASNPEETCWGISVTISGGSEMEAHSNYNYTKSTGSWNMWLALRDFLYGK